MKRYQPRYDHRIIPLLEEIVTKKNTNLQKEYDKMNDLAFEGKLPRVPLRWGRTKNAGGRVISFGFRNDPSSWQVKVLEISLFLENTYEQFQGILAHEMIHVYLIVNGIRNLDKTGHGIPFIHEMNRINKMNLGFEVPLKDTMETKNVSSSVKAKQVGVVLISKNLSIQVYNISAMPEVIKTFMGFSPDWKAQTSVTFIYSSDRNLNKFPVQRGFKTNRTGGFTSYGIDREYFNKLINEGKFLYKMDG